MFEDETNKIPLFKVHVILCIDIVHVHNFVNYRLIFFVVSAVDFVYVQ